MLSRFAGFLAHRTIRAILPAKPSMPMAAGLQVIRRFRHAAHCSPLRVSALRAHRGDESEQRAARPGSRRARHRRFNQSGDRPPTSVRRLLRYLIHVVGWAHRQELGLRELA